MAAARQAPRGDEKKLLCKPDRSVHWSKCNLIRPRERKANRLQSGDHHQGNKMKRVETRKASFRERGCVGFLARIHVRENKTGNNPEAINGPKSVLIDGPE